MPFTEPQRVLKANAIRGLGSKIAFNYEDLRRRCDEYVEQVRQQTRKMLADAHREADAIRHSVQQAAHETGLREGLQEADDTINRRAQELAAQGVNEKLKTALPALQAGAEALVRERDRWLAEWERTAVSLSVAIAEKLIKHQLQVNPDDAGEMLAEMLALAAGNSGIRVRMNPIDIDLLGDNAVQVVRSMAACGETELIADEAIDCGGCFVETQHGIIDARIETQLERITSELLQGITE